MLVVALGADLDPAATPGLVEGGHEFYTEPGAFALRDVLANFAGGRVIVGVTSAPFKCPPAPSETALLVHELSDQRRASASSPTSTLVMPLPVPIPPSPGGVEGVAARVRRARHHVRRRPGGARPRPGAPGRGARRRRPSCPTTSSSAIPKHVAPPVVAASGMCVDGWIPVDPLTLETSFADVYAVGDVTSVGTPKAGVFAEGQAAVVADAIIARHRGGADADTYDGHGVCYIEFGDGQVGKVDVTFRAGQPPVGVLEGPSPGLAADKADFGADRIRRWFGRDWATF